MCRNIKTLYNFEPPVTEDEVRAAALRTSARSAASTSRPKPTKPPLTPRSMPSPPFPEPCSTPSKPTRHPKTAKTKPPKHAPVLPSASPADARSSSRQELSSSPFSPVVPFSRTSPPLAACLSLAGGHQHRKIGAPCSLSTPMRRSAISSK